MSKAEIQDDEKKNTVNHLETTFIITVLKYCSSEEHPLSAGDIANRLVSITQEYHDPKTVLRKLQDICALLEEGDEKTCNAFVLTYGGYVCRTCPGDGKGKKPQYKFYFEPLLLPSDISMMQGAIASNRYIPPLEENYLLKTLELLAPEEPLTEEELDAYLPTVPSRYVNRKKGPKYMDLMGTVNTLHAAIEKKLQVELEYGHYIKDANTFRKISFVSKNPQKPYLLNPYALFWNHGEYYLLATHKGHDNPTYFRVDRIVSVQLHRDEQQNPLPRAPIPEDLRKYFTTEKDGDEYFDTELYTSVHPLLALAQEEALTECVLECKSEALSLLVDTFGSTEILGDNIQIEASTREHVSKNNPGDKTPSEKPESYYTVRIPNIQPESIISFCVQHHSLVKVISPFMLVLAVSKEMIDSVTEYANLTHDLLTVQNSNINPFLTLGETLLHSVSPKAATTVDSLGQITEGR